MFNFIILHTFPFRRMLFLDAVEPSGINETVHVNPFLEKAFPRRAKRYFDHVLRHSGKEDGFYRGRRALLCQGMICKRPFSDLMDLLSLPDEQCYIHLPLLETRDDEDFFGLRMHYGESCARRGQWYQYMW